MIFSGLLFAGAIQAQWIPEKCITKNNLNAIASASCNSGWIVGDKGTILKKADKHWVEWQKPTTHNLYSVFMVDENDGWAVGGKGTIIHFDGNYWRPFTSPTRNNLYSVSFKDHENGIAVGDFGTILIFKNGIWDLVGSGINARLSAVSIETDNAWIGGGLECVNVPLIKMEMNKKEKTLTKSYDSYASINSLTFLNAENGWAVGSPSILLHFDGKQWIKADVNDKFSSLRSVFFSDENHGISVGYGGTILTYNEGRWMVENSLNAGNLRGGTIIGDSYYAIGDSGTILSAKVLPEKFNRAHVYEPFNRNVRLFPNPCKDLLNIKLPVSYTDKYVLISVLSIQGQVLLQKEFNSNQLNAGIQLNTSQFNNGAYILKIDDGSAISETNFVILH